jgi:hypothetical protein
MGIEIRSERLPVHQNIRELKKKKKKKKKKPTFLFK